MSEVKRRVHSAEFKAKVGLEALRGAKTLNEIGQEYASEAEEAECQVLFFASPAFLFQKPAPLAK